MLVAALVFPLTWSAPEVMRTCGQTAGQYALGDCSLRWAYLLAVIGCLDAVILSILAFILATRHVKLQPEPTYGMNGSLYKGTCSYLSCRTNSNPSNNSCGVKRGRLALVSRLD